MPLQSIKDLNLRHKRVFLRADLNVPLENKKIIQDFKLISSIPTIKYIQDQGGKVILATHIGQPDAKSFTNFFDENLSTQNLLEWFQNQGFKIRLEPDLLKAELWSKEDFSEILLLENLRFFNGEKGTKEERQLFVETLKPLADIYINDAFGTIHRNDTSITLLPEKFEKQNRAIGLLMEAEIKELNKLKQKPTQPFVLVLGGAKIKDKIPLLQNFLDQTQQNCPSSIIIGGAMAYTFLKAQGFCVGKSLVEDKHLEFAKDFLARAQNQNVKVLLPLDHLVIKNKFDITTLLSESSEKLSKLKSSFYATKKIPKTGICLDIGPKTIELFTNELKNAKTIFANGTMGIYTVTQFANGSKEILTAIAESECYSIAGGGDCVAAVFMFKLQEQFDFLSTGGGATLNFLGAKSPEENFEALKIMCG